MFYGLSKFFKNILPKSLFYRALLIVAVPVIVLQLVITIVFFDSLWIKTNKGMTKAVVNEVNTFIKVYSDETYDKNYITNLFSVYQDLNIEYVIDDNFDYSYDERWFSPSDRTLRRELKSKFGSGEFWFDTIGYKELIDLRTPLTRMKLQVAFITDKNLANKLSEDINEMEKMLNEYLQFTSSSHLEKDEQFDLSNLLDEVIKKYDNKDISSSISPRLYFSGRKNLIKRSINNLIDNAIKYAKKVNISINKSNNNIFIIIEDDGPGIPEKEYNNVFKPFYKIDKGRADSKSSVGLGLSIASDVIRSHGGNIKLSKSSMNGLAVKIFLPF